MTEQEALEQLARVFDAFPSYRRFLSSLKDANGDSIGDRTIDAWAAMLATCDRCDVVAVVSEIVSGDREPVAQYQSQDMLARNIKSEANERRSNRRSKKNQFEKYHVSMERLRNSDRRLKFASHESIRLGVAVRTGKITEEENERRMPVLIDWLNRRTDDLYWVQTEARTA